MKKNYSSEARTALAEKSYSHGDRRMGRSRVVYFPVCLYVVPVINSTALHPKREGEEGSLKQKHWTGDNER